MSVGVDGLPCEFLSAGGGKSNRLPMSFKRLNKHIIMKVLLYGLVDFVADTETGRWKTVKVSCSENTSSDSSRVLKSA